MTINDNTLQSLEHEDEDNSALLDFVQSLADHARTLVLLPLLVGLIALGVAFTIPPTYTAKTQFMPPQQPQSAAASALASLGALGGLAGAASGLKNPSDQYIALLKSRSVTDTMIERFQLMKLYELEFKDDARKKLNMNTRIMAGKDGLISVEVDDTSAKNAADIANAYVPELQKLMGRLAITEAQQRRAFFEKQLLISKDKLAAAETSLKSTGINSSALKASPQAAVEGVAKLKAAVTVQELKIASMRGYLAESAPDFKQALNELGALRGQLSAAGRSDESGNRSDSDYVARYREVKYQETLFELFAKQFELAKVDESREGATIQVVDVAEVPERKSKPSKALIALAAMALSFFALIFYYFVKSQMGAGQRSAETNERLTNIKQSFKRAIGLRY